MKAPVGAIVSIYCDTGAPLVEGSYLRTPAGRLYCIVTLRRQARGKHVGRWHLRCLVDEAVEPGRAVYPLYWYRRGRRAA